MVVRVEEHDAILKRYLYLMSTINKFLILTLLISSALNFYGCQMEEKDESEVKITHKIVIVEPGYEGFLYKPNSIGIDTTKAFNKGPHKILLDEEMYQYSICQQILMVENNVEINSGRTLHASIKLHYSVKRGKASRVHYVFGPDYTGYIEGEFISVCEPLLKEVDFPETDFEKVEKLENEILRKFVRHMSTSGFSIKYLAVEKIEVLK